MANESEEQKKDNKAEESTEEVEIEEGDEGDNKDEKDDKSQHQETPEAKRARLKRQLEQLDKKHGFKDEEKKSETQKSKELDYGQKAFLVANGIKGSDETALVQEIMENTGKSLDDVLENKYFQAELKELREAKSVADATPKGQKRSNQSARDTVDYWVAKGELPPADQRELRTKVVNARIKIEQNKKIFTDQNVVR